MGKRGTNTFRKRDVERAIRSARDAGIAPGVVEVETKDGTIIRVFSGDVAAATEDDSGARAWNTEIKKLRATSPKGGTGNG